MSISVCIISYNEESNIKDCLESVRWADEIIVVDSGSTDRTREIAESIGAKVVHHKWEGYVNQKNFALSLATKDWVFCLDSDERCTPQLADEIRQAIQNNSVDGFQMKRHTYYLHKWINHCGWYPDYKLRLAKRSKCRWDGVDPHDKLTVDGVTSKLDGEIHHYTYKNFSHQIRVINTFSDIVRDEWIKKEKKLNIFLMFLHPPLKFIEVYFYKLGFLDGLAGFIISIASAFYVFSKHVKLWESKK